MDSPSALLAVSAFHAGFQLVVSAVVYPALADVPPADWTVAHDRHSRRILVVVAPLYPAIVVVCAWVLLSGPPAWALVAVAANLLAVAVTAGLAAPLHGRLGRDGRSPAAITTLLRADRVRTAGAVVALLAACLA